MAVLPCTILLPIMINKARIESINSFVAILFNAIPTLVVFVVAISSKGVPTGGLISNNTGLIYQNISYYAAFSYGISVFILQEVKKGIYTTKVRLLVYPLMLFKLLHVC